MEKEKGGAQEIELAYVEMRGEYKKDEEREKKLQTKKKGVALISNLDIHDSISSSKL